MPIEGGRLNAHKQRIADLRRRKSDQQAKMKTYRAKNIGKIHVDNVSAETLARIKKDIQQRARKLRRRDILWLIISMIIAVVVLFLFTQKYS